MRCSPACAVLILGCATVQPTRPQVVPTWSPVTESAAPPNDHAQRPISPFVYAVRGDGQGPYQPPSEAEQAEVSRFVAQILAGRSPEPSPWLSLENLGDGVRGLIAARGHGVYLLREHARTQLVIETPHSFADLHTLAIGLALFHGLGARALLVNGTQRFVGCGDEGPCPADVAHAKTSVFQGVHLALADDPALTFVQVHGFREAEGEPLAIVSAAGTTADPGPVADVLRSGLAALSARPVAVFPTDIDRLGGLTNVQARSLVPRGGRMLHMELARSLRERLAVAGPLQDVLLQALYASKGE